MLYDLLVQHGRVIDPSQNLDDTLDVAIAQGKIAAIGKNLQPESAKQVLDASGSLVTPGLIDIHIHAAEHDESINADVDTVGIKMGVTTVVDAGSSGILNFVGYRKLVEPNARTRIFFIPVTSLVFGFAGNFAGLKVGSDLSPDNYSLRKAAELFEQHKDVIVGFKCIPPVQHEDDTESIPLNLSKEITNAIGVPLTVHLGWIPYYPWLRTDRVLAKLGKGDIATHVFRRKGGILDENNRVYPEAYDAQERGVIFDIGHGRGNFDFDAARRSLDQGIRPFTISSDVMDKSSVTGPVFSLTETMSKFLYLGLDLVDVITMTTCNAARAICREQALGSLAIGRVADLSILDYREGLWKFNDGVNVVNWEGRKLIPRYAIQAGEMVPCEYPPGSLRGDELMCPA